MPANVYLTLILAVLLAAAATVAVLAQLPAGALIWIMPAFAVAAWLAHRYRG